MLLASALLKRWVGAIHSENKPSDMVFFMEVSTRLRPGALSFASACSIDATHHDNAWKFNLNTPRDLDIGFLVFPPV